MHSRLIYIIYLAPLIAWKHFMEFQLLTLFEVFPLVCLKSLRGESVLRDFQLFPTVVFSATVWVVLFTFIGKRVRFSRLLLPRRSDVKILLEFVWEVTPKSSLLFASLLMPWMPPSRNVPDWFQSSSCSDVMSELIFERSLGGGIVPEGDKALAEPKTGIVSGKPIHWSCKSTRLFAERLSRSPKAVSRNGLPTRVEGNGSLGSTSPILCRSGDISLRG